jgi:hypothetical protein
MLPGKTMKLNKYWLLACGYLLLSLGFAFILGFQIRRLPDVGQPRENTQLWAYSGHPVSQIFTTKHDGLNIVTVYLKNVSLRNQDPFEFILSAGSQPLQTIRISGYNIGDGADVPFQFEPIPNSAGKTFTFTLVSGSGPDLAIGAGYSSIDQSLAYQTYYYPTNHAAVVSAVLSGFIGSLMHLRFLLLLGGLGLAGYWLAVRIYKWI